MDDLRALRDERDELRERCRQLTAVLRGEDLPVYAGVHLTAQARTLLAALMGHPGLVCHANLIDRLDLVSRGNGGHTVLHLRVVMCNLRHALRPTGATVENVHGVGFAMTPASKALLNAHAVH